MNCICGIPLVGRQALYCSPLCRSRGDHLNRKPCATEGCTKPSRKGGHCSPCYRLVFELMPSGKSIPECTRCGRRMVYALRDDPVCRSCASARKSEVRKRAERRARSAARGFTRKRRIVNGHCDWCGDEFTIVIPATGNVPRWCSRTCKRRRAAARRRGEAYGSASHYTWTEVMHLFLLFGRCCAYCEQPIQGQPDPDHVVPLSRGGGNSITNILPCCSPCNSDKRDLSLEAWAADRARRSLPPVITQWSDDDPRVMHLTVTHATVPAAA